jgi:PhnB protein
MAVQTQTKPAKPASKAKGKPKAAAKRPTPQTVTPHLVCAGAAEAIEFYKKAFGAEEMMRLPGKDGKLMHAAVQIRGAMIMLVDEMPEWGALSPKSLKGTPVTIHLYVDDVDQFFARAVKAGATAKMPVTDMFWGDRYGVLVDPFGHSWSIATPQREVTAEELKEAMKNMGACAAAKD